jgi:hypothetical protein
MLPFLAKIHPSKKECWKGVDIMIQQNLRKCQYYDPTMGLKTRKTLCSK